MSHVSVMPAGVTIAGLGARFVAAIVDGLPFAVISFGVTALTTYANLAATTSLVVSIIAAVLWLAWVLYLWWGYATRGAGPGAKLMKIEVLSLSDGRPVGWGRIFLRELVWSAAAAFVIPWIVLVVMMVTHQRRQGWHDLAAKSVTVKRSRVLESGGSGPRSSVQAANIVGLPAHLGGSSFAGSPGSSSELPSSIAYTPSGLGGPAGGPITGVPGAFAPPPQQPAPMPAPSYQPTPQPVPQPVQPYQQPMPQMPAAPPAAAPAPAFPRQQAAAPAVPWEQWGVAAPGAQPQAAPAPQPAPSPYATSSFAPPPPPPPPPPTVAPVGPPPAQPAPSPYPVRPSQSDDFGGTHLAAPPAAAPERGTDAGWQVRLDDGRVIEIDGVVLIGRNPAARPDETVTQLIRAGADSRMVSKTHLALGVDGRGLYVTDRGSTNGTAIANSNGQFEPCAAGEQVRLREGQVVSFGDRYLEVRRTRS